MTSITLRGRIMAVTATTVLLGAALSGCGSPGGQLGDDLATMKSCPVGGINTQAAVDGTLSSRSESTKATNLKEIATTVRTAALCGGHVRVFGFASSSGQTVTIYDGDLSVDASTDNAHVRKAEKLADSIMATVAANYDPALDQLSGAGTDVIGMLDLLRDAKAQAPNVPLRALIMTDGLTNTDGTDPTIAPSTAEAEAMAEQVPVPDLAGVSVRMVGVGHQAIGELPSGVIAKVKAFWTCLLTRTGAGPILVVTEGQ